MFLSQVYRHSLGLPVRLGAVLSFSGVPGTYLFNMAPPQKGVLLEAQKGLPFR